MKYQITHLSEYTYSSSAALSQNEVCLGIRPTGYQKIFRQQWDTEPQADYHRDRVDFFGNHWRLYSFENPHLALRITTHHLVEVSRERATGNKERKGFEPFLYPSPFVRISEDFARYGRDLLEPRPTREGLLELNRRLFRDFSYDSEATTITTPVEEFFRDRRGVCQDFAHLGLAVLRSLGIPARYMSGYLNTVPPPGQEKVQGADASHAWLAAYLPEEGWVEIDPTNGVVVENNHITISWGRDYGDVTPLRGVVLGGGTQKLRVEVTVQALEGDSAPG